MPNLWKNYLSMEKGHFISCLMTKITSLMKLFKTLNDQSNIHLVVLSTQWWNPLKILPWMPNFSNSQCKSFLQEKIKFSKMKSQKNGLRNAVHLKMIKKFMNLKTHSIIFTKSQIISHYILLTCTNSFSNAYIQTLVSPKSSTSKV